MSRMQGLLENREVARFFFEKNVVVEGGCHIWQGAVLQRGGYGSFTCRPLGVYPQVRAHRAAWAIYCGEVLPEDVHLLHECDNPLCVNVAHLHKGDQKQNISEMVAKGRSAKGEQHSQAKLTETEARAIYALKGKGLTAVAVSRDFGITDTTVRDIWRKKSWKHIHN